MDWSKVRTLLIGVLLLFNLFLLSILLRQDNNQDISDSLISDAKSILSQNNVKITCKIPNNTSDIGSFSVNPFVYNAQSLTHLKNRVNVDFEGHLTYIDPAPKNISAALKDQKSAEEFALDYLEQLGLSKNKFQLNTVDKKTDSYLFTFREVYKYYVLYDNFVKVSIENTLVTVDAQINQYKNVSSVNRSIVPAYQVLLQNLNGEEKITISAIDLGIKTLKMKQTSGEFYLSPATVWRIQQEGGIERFFVASTGSEITLQ